MRRALALLGILALALQAAADEASSHALVEIAVSKDTAWAGETVRLTLRIGYDRDWFREHAAPLFLRSVDVPVQVECPAFRTLPGMTPLPRPVENAPEAQDAVRIAVNDSVIEATPVADRVVGGRTFTVLEVVRPFRSETAGRREVAAPTLRFVRATRFEEDLVRGRVPVDPQDVLFHGTGTAIDVRPLPEEGRPPEFEGAVGRFRVSATAVPTAVAETRSLAIAFAIEGEGNLDAIPTPHPFGLEAFHVFGATEEKAPGRRTVVFSVAPRDTSVREVPPIPFAFFDPGPPAGYRVVRTAAIPVEMPPVAAPSPLWRVEVRPELDRNSIGDIVSRWWALAGVVALFAALALVVWRLHRML